jgi:large subunit ribosomal protein L46
MPWAEKKQAAKERRRELYGAKQERNTRLQTRRQSPRDDLRRAFRGWFIPRKVTDEYMERKARQAGLGWQIKVAVILERINVVLPDKEDWDIEYDNMRGHLLQFGPDYPKALFPSSKPTLEGETAFGSEEDLFALLAKKGFTPAPRETEADKSGNVRTTDRKLKTNVVLAVQENDQWQLPTVELLEDETFFEAAKRAIPEKVGEEVEFWCPSNCPCAVDMQAFPEDQRKDGFYGTKTFFMKVQYDEGAVSEQSMTVDDFAWLDRTEMEERGKAQQGDEMSKFYRYMLTV